MGMIERADVTQGSAYEITQQEDWRAAGEVLVHLRPTLDVDSFVSRRVELSAKGLRLVAVKRDGEIVSVGSFTISPHIRHGHEMLVHDMATRKQELGCGYGTRVVEQLERIAKDEGCFRVFVHTRNASGFYERNGYERYSTGMVKTVDR
jgi:GNAT superfamily N-acetyltransferase